MILLTPSQTAAAERLGWSHEEYLDRVLTSHENECPPSDYPDGYECCHSRSCPGWGEGLWRHAHKLHVGERGPEMFVPGLPGCITGSA